MKKLYAGLAAAALTATGIACTAGAAHADTANWPEGFTASGIASTTGSLYEVGSYYVEADDSSGDDLVQVTNGVPSLVDLGTDAEPLAIAAHGDKVYVTGMDTDYDSVLWTVVNGTVTNTRVLHAADDGLDEWPASVAVSPSGDDIAVGDQYGIEVLPAAGDAAEMTSTLADDEEGFDNSTQVAFSSDGSSVYAAVVTDDNAVKEWTVPVGEGTVSAPAAVTVMAASDENPLIRGLVGDANDIAYLAIGDTSKDGIYAVKGGAATQTQPIDRIAGLTLSADGSALYALSYYAVQAFPIGSSRGEPAYYSTTGDTNALAVEADGSLAVAEQKGDGTNLVETVKASKLYPGVLAGKVTITGTARVGSTLTASTSGWPTGTSLTYRWGAVYSQGQSGGLRDIAGGASKTLALTPALSGEKVAVTVTGHLNDGAHNDTTVYSSVVTVAAAAQTSQTPAQAHPAKVTKIKAAKIKSSSKKFKLKLRGITNAPGKVKVYVGKKLVGKATIKNGKLVVKLKKRFHKGKHKITLKYAGSAKVAKFHKKIKIKVK